jgi:hypothetical protein
VNRNYVTFTSGRDRGKTFEVTRVDDDGTVWTSRDTGILGHRADRGDFRIATELEVQRVLRREAATGGIVISKRRAR